MHPAMARAWRAPSAVLVLGGGDGMAGARDPQVPQRRAGHAGRARPAHDPLFSTAPTLRALNHDALRTQGAHRQRRRLRLAGAERRPFDVIVVDFPDPTNFSIGKLYTTSFYQLVDEHLAAGGYAVVQTTSPLIARRSFWTVVATIEAVGLSATPYHAHVPSFGEWGFILASRHRSWPAGVAAAEGPRFLDARRLARCSPSARHGARRGRAEPAVEPGAGAPVRGRVGARCSCAPAHWLAADPAPCWAAARLARRGTQRAGRQRWVGARTSVAPPAPQQPVARPRQRVRRPACWWSAPASLGLAAAAAAARRHRRLVTCSSSKDAPAATARG